MSIASVDPSTDDDLLRTQAGVSRLASALKDALFPDNGPVSPVVAQSLHENGGADVRAAVELLLAVGNGERQGLLSEACVDGQRLVAPQVTRIARSVVSKLGDAFLVQGSASGFRVTQLASSPSIPRQ